MFAVRQIKTYNFMGHAQRCLDLPAKGIVLITGPNGSGKSTFIEAVAVAFWGSTLRGMTPWRTNVPGSVEVLTDAFHVRRGVDKAGKSNLVWNEAGKPLARSGKDAKGDTPAKAQAALERCITTQDVWAWSCVLSNLDTSTFSASTDATRRQLLESMMSLASTDEELALLRKELAGWRTELATVEGRRAVLVTRLAAERLRQQEAESYVDRSAPVDLAELTDQGRRAAEALKTASAAVAAARASIERMGQGIAGLQAQAAAATASASAVEQRHRLCSRSECPTCGQPIASELARVAGEELARALKAKQTAAAQLAEERARVTAEQAAKRAELTELVRIEDTRRGELEECRRKYMAAQGEESRRARVAEVKAQAATTIATLELEVAEVDKRLVDLRRFIARDEYVETLLSPKGVRARVLAGTLTSISEVANGWLSKIAGPTFRLGLRPYSDRGNKNSISLDIRGAGGGHGYKASSGGERKRIDLAMMLALGDISRQAHGAKTSTLFFDEAFDSLDVDGRLRCVQVLKELAQDRCVVVVSHDDRLIKALESSCQRVHLE